jgi:hypothetical protein
MKTLIIILATGLLTLSTTSCQKRKAEKRLEGTYQRTLPAQIQYIDSTTQILLEANIVSFTNGTFAWNGVVVGDCKYETKKVKDKSYDLEIVLSDPNYSLMLPQWYVQNGAGEWTNSVIPNYTVLNTAHYYIENSDEDNLSLIIKTNQGTTTYQFTKI